MPNGPGLSPEEFESLELPLRKVDQVVDDFAKQRNAKVIRNYHGSPDRQIQWVDTSGVTKAILVSPICKYFAQVGGVRRSVVYRLSVVAHKDYPDTGLPNMVDPTRPRTKRKWWHKSIAEISEIPVDQTEFLTLLENGYDQVNAIREGQLMPV